MSGNVCGGRCCSINSMHTVYCFKFTVKSLPKFEHCSINKMTLAVLLLYLD